MRLYDCDHCGQTIHFDNRSCVNCGHRLAFVPEHLAMHALVQDEGEETWHLVARPDYKVRHCANAAMDICNWTVSADDPHPFCPACRHNRLVPDASTEVGLSQWRRISQAQRHLFYSLLRWNLPHTNRDEDPQGGLVFDFLIDAVQPDGTVVPAMTGHEDGLIAIRAAEADDATREQVRVSMNEPYRTMLGHFRHETGHYVWDKLVRDGGRLEEFRAIFGDETVDYGAALQRNYEQGPPPGWQDFYISTYASTHPWEDFAECFAHYLHIVDTLETARAYGMVIEPRGHAEMAAEVAFNPYAARDAEQLVSAWVPFSMALNSIHRSMGQPDLYPFVLSQAVMVKLEYIHRLIRSRRG
ncbi:Conserved hypothethical protein, UCP012641 [Neorhizobium galegae bv. officinalis bv. officinalis str. HAMBI 1141]|uniref:Conserved hypothethical protein, UCP012641 n=1 Tax=Neorhizobium galegae bv. officinalis bv. officinalis str. HAMBI 1141 TaxID=1028801 RepID=A0A068T3E0_NEOGA|nr:putative zinc-binding metallopeptidase [Neorhizobium galegae]CDN52987.1 Conserved hypothethical protein, UCP012641 [Neorhizobium galegae bv. officinalis bv. officinalis str. HAMBI 1141]